MTLLRSAVAENIFLLSVLHRAGLRYDVLTHDGVFYGTPTAGPLKAIVYVTAGGLCVPFSREQWHMRALAARLRGKVSPRLLVGPRDCADAFWEALHVPMQPRINRPHRLYTLVEGQLLVEGHRDVRPAGPLDLEQSVDFAARMQAEELGVDPRAVDARRFRRRIFRLISEELFFILPVDSVHGFQASASSFCVEGTQVEAVYTPRHLRGHGYATMGLAGMCRLLLMRFPLVTLHVNEQNEAAVKLYERLGFQHSTAFRLISL